jgi:hypothetical protein
MMAALPILRVLHELLWYVDEALALPSSAPIADRLRSALADVTESASAPADRILDVVVDDLRARFAPLLREASRLARAGFTGPDLSERDLSGADLRDADLRGACLRGATLLGADLRGLDLEAADLLGADLRGRGPARRPAGRLVVRHRTQLGSALGDGRTTVPSRWSDRRSGPAERCLPSPVRDTGVTKGDSGGR